MYSVMDDSFSLMGFIALKHYLVFTCVTFYCLDWVKCVCMFIYNYMKVVDAFISKYLCLQVEYFIPVWGLPNM